MTLHSTTHTAPYRPSLTSAFLSPLFPPITTPPDAAGGQVTSSCHFFKSTFLLSQKRFMDADKENDTEAIPLGFLLNTCLHLLSVYLSPSLLSLSCPSFFPSLSRHVASYFPLCIAPSHIPLPFSLLKSLSLSVCDCV